MKQVQLAMSIEQANVVKNVLDLYFQIGSGQLEEIESVLKDQLGFDRKRDRLEGESDHINWLNFNNDIQFAKYELGLSRDAYYGIGSPKLTISTLRSYEIYKALAFTLAMDKDPNPAFKTTDYDAVIVKYTNDPIPIVNIISS